MKAAAMVLRLELGLGLRTRAMHEHDAHAQRSKEIEIDGELPEASVGYELPAEGDDERLAAKRVDIRRRRLEPVYEPVLCRKPEPAPTRAALRPRDLSLGVLLLRNVYFSLGLGRAAAQRRSAAAT